MSIPYTWDSQRGLCIDGISRASVTEITAFVAEAPQVFIILDHATNPHRRQPSDWWIAQLKLYGLEYPSESAKEIPKKARKILSAVRGLRIPPAITTIENNLKRPFKHQQSGAAKTASRPADQNSRTPSSDAIVTTDEPADDDLQQRSGGLQDGNRYIVPARRDLKRKAASQYPDEEAADGAAPKIRRLDGTSMPSPRDSFSSSPRRDQSDSDPLAVTGLAAPCQGRRLCVGNLCTEMTENHLRQVFSLYDV